MRTAYTRRRLSFANIPFYKEIAYAIILDNIALVKASPPERLLTKVNNSHKMAWLFVKSIIFIAIVKHLRVNRQINSPTVRLISDDQEQVGIMGLDKALALAHEKNLDLIEVSPKANPPVCKIMDYGKYLYQLKKAEQKQKKGMKKTEIKGIRLSLRTDVGDLNIKINKAKQFLADGNIVKVQLMFKGREIIHSELGLAKIITFRDALKEVAKIDLEPKMQGHMMNMMLSPLT